MAIVRPNQVWSTDITNIRLARGFVYLVAIIDWYSRRVLSWRISNSMEAVFCVDCLEDALRAHGKPEIFNSDQGSQFTLDGFTGVLKREGITISMDGRGRAFDLHLCGAASSTRTCTSRAIARWVSCWGLPSTSAFTTSSARTKGCKIAHPTRSTKVVAVAAP